MAVLNQEMLLKCAAEHGLVVLPEEESDSLIQRIVNAACREETYAGCGISRSCFLSKGFAIKVPRGAYNVGHDEEIDWEGEWEDPADFLDEVAITENWYEGIRQNEAEIDAFTNSTDEFKSLVAELYAYSTNKLVEIMEACNITREEDGECALYADDDRTRKLRRHFQDAHTNNVGFNRFGVPVMLDYGEAGID